MKLQNRPVILTANQRQRRLSLDEPVTLRGLLWSFVQDLWGWLLKK